MAIILDKEGRDKLTRTIGKRLKAARRAARITESEAAVAIGHSTITQISLAEKGERILTLQTLIVLADLYSVPLDFIVGRTDDPIADPAETNHAVIVRAIAGSVKDCFEKFSQAVAEHSAIMMSGHRQERIDLKAACDAAVEVKNAWERVKQLNPEFEEDLKGGSNLEKSVSRILGIAERHAARLEHEARLISELERDVGSGKIDDHIQQFMLDLVVQ